MSEAQAIVKIAIGMVEIMPLAVSALELQIGRTHRVYLGAVVTGQRSSTHLRREDELTAIGRTRH